MTARLRAVAIAMLVSFGLLGAVQVYWQVVAAPLLVGAPFDRHAELTAKITRPGSIISADGRHLLAPVQTDGRWVFRYAMPRAFAHLTGYNARTGLQKKLAAALLGKPPYADLRYQILNGRPRGADIVLTIVSDIQAEALRLLNDKPGCAVVLRVADGAILAAASSPSFDCVEVSADPTALEIVRTDPAEPLVFRPAQKLYRPGWAMAWVTAAAALAAGQGQRRYLCEGSWRLKTLLVECPRAHGRLSVLEAATRGCRVAVAECADALGPDRFRATVKRLHLLDRPALGLDGLQGRMPDLYNWRGRRNLVGAALGIRQTRLTPLAVARFFLTLAADGRLLQPYLIQEIRSPSGKVFERGQARTLGQAMEPQVARTLRDLLRRAAASGELPGILGDADAAACAWWLGTTEPHLRRGEAWFVALSPADSPRLVVLVVVERTQDASTAASVGASLLHYAQGMLLAG